MTGVQFPDEQSVAGMPRPARAKTLAGALVRHGWARTAGQASLFLVVMALLAIAAAIGIAVQGVHSGKTYGNAQQFANEHPGVEPAPTK